LLLLNVSFPFSDLFQFSPLSSDQKILSTPYPTATNIDSEQATPYPPTDESCPEEGFSNISFTVQSNFPFFE
jgi:hypothetical protein